MRVALGCGAVRRVFRLVIFGLLAPALGWAQEPEVAVLPLRYRTVEQVIPVIRPMLAPGGTVAGMRGQVIVRTTPDNLAEVRRILASIDTPARRLTITVRQDAAEDYAAQRSGALVLDSAAVAGARDLHAVQATEGNVAFVQVGQVAPVPQQWAGGVYGRGRAVDPPPGSRALPPPRGRDGPYAGGGYLEPVPAEYREATSGFYALPRVSGDRVTLEVSPWREALSARVAGGVDVQKVVTTVSGRLGEWIEVAGVTRSAAGDGAVVLGQTSHRAAGARRVLVKVEEVK